MKMLTKSSLRALRRSLLALPLLAAACNGQTDREVLQAGLDHPNHDEIEALIEKMTMEEKVGQLNFLYSGLISTGPNTPEEQSAEAQAEQIRKGEVTGFFNMYGAAITGELQRIAVEESRLGIPLIFGADVIHGFKTIFPIPLGETASWDLEAIEKSARIQAIESTAVGITVNFAPMVDIARDSRWGRMAEGAGEDPYLGALAARARVRGMQGDDLAANNTFAATVKHFAAYGAPEGGRDYNTVDMSERMLRQTYLQPYKAALDEGAAAVMTSFNELDGVPATGNAFLLDQILRKEWGFDGLVMSDWMSIGEMLAHGNVADSLEAAKLALEAGTDMDMMSSIYLEQVPKLIAAGRMEEAVLDQAVRRVLEIKYNLGLFDDPYQYSQVAREQSDLRNEEHIAAARDIARKSMVLLQNENEVLPLSAAGKTIAVIGPLGDAASDMNGTWSFFAEAEHAVPFLQGIRERVGDAGRVVFAKGCNLYDNDKGGMAEAVRVARSADVVILALGEAAVMNGEGASRANLTLPGIQQELAKAIAATGKPTVALISSGRGLDLTWEAENLDALLLTWSLGSEAGRAAADVIFGDYNPSGKLPISFPRHVGQEPLYYNHKNTGRPYEGDHSEPLSERVYRSRYRDVPNSPLFPFGHGLSYTSFEYSDLAVTMPTEADAHAPVSVSVKVTNSGARDGAEVVQLYIRDVVASATRPVKELKGFEKIVLAAGESKTLTFQLDEGALCFYRADRTWGVEPGEFQVMVGGSSEATLETNFILE